jgi:DNA polymerase-3 subunit beta
MNAALSIVPTLTTALCASLDRRAFAAALARLKHVVDRRAALPALEAVLLAGTADALHLTVTDGSVFVRVAVPATVTSSWASLLVPLRRLLEVTKGPNTRLQLAGDQVTAGGATHRLATLPTATFPAVPPPSGAVLFTLMRPTLARVLRQTSYAMSCDDTRPHLASMLIERRGDELVFVATDGHRLAKVCVPDDGEDFSVLVGRRTIESVERMLAVAGGLVRLRREGDRLWFTSGEEWVSGPIVDAVFPSYEQVIPAHARGRLTMVTADLAVALRAVAARGTPSVTLRLDSATSSVTLAVDDGEGNVAEATVAAVFDGTLPKAIGFNGSYLRELVDALGDDGSTVTMQVTGEVDPVRVDGTHGTTAVVMPLRI